MSKIRILEVIGSMNLGGAETFLMNVLRNIDRKKFELYFLCYSSEKYDYEDEINYLGGHIIRVNKIGKNNFYKYISMLKKILVKYKINVVHSHTAYNTMFPILAAKEVGIKNIITHSHNTTFADDPSIIKRIYFKLSSFIINKYSKECLACGNEAGLALYQGKRKYTIIDNGIIIENFSYSKEIRNKKRKELNISSKEFVVAHIGRFDEQKNHTFLIDIFESYLNKYDKNSKLVLIGDGTLRNTIEEKVKKIGITKNVLFLGKRKDVKDLYSAFDVLLFPSLYEGLPVTLIEAQANGLPILASNVIDSDVDITKTISFYPLSTPIESWSKELHKLKGKRYDCNELLLNSVYNMSKNIKKIEEIYEKNI